MIKNEILLKRICQMISQTFAVPIEQVITDAKSIGIEAIIENLENSDQNKPKY